MTTRTYRFGSGRKEGHDSSEFYGRALFKGRLVGDGEDATYGENQVPEEFLDKIVLGDAREVLKRIPERSVHLMVTSPPYNVGKEYDKDMTLEQYLDFMEEVLREVYRVLVHGGRICLNVADLGKKPFLPIHAYMVGLLEDIGYILRGIVIWYKGKGVAGSSTAWGSFKSASNPVLRDVHEYIIVASKGALKRNPKGKESTITGEEYAEFTKSVWEIRPESAKRVGHPAPYPVEIPYRCIQLYTFKGDVVLDPFIGSGTTAVAAVRTGRHYVGIDINEEYVKMARRRVGDEKSKISMRLE